MLNTKQKCRALSNYNNNNLIKKLAALRSTDGQVVCALYLIRMMVRTKYQNLKSVTALDFMLETIMI